MYVPKNNPIIKGLNSYYLNLDKLLEFYKASMLSGCVHLKTHESEAAVYLSNEMIQRVIFEENGIQILDGEALQSIASRFAKSNFIIDIYQLSEELLKFCCNITNAETLQSNISTEFVDVRKLVQKIMNDKITGFVEMEFESGADKKYLFFDSGVIVGSSDSMGETEYGNTDILSRLVRELESSKGILSIKAIPRNGAANGEPRIMEKTSAAAPKRDFASLVNKIKLILSEMDKLVSKSNGNKEKFAIVLKRKFLQKADKYTFLDPFEEEVSYDGKKLTVSSSVDQNVFIEAIRECLLEIGAEHGMSNEIENQLRAIGS